MSSWKIQYAYDGNIKECSLFAKRYQEPFVY